jgi:voltage-gated potassium channel
MKKIKETLYEIFSTSEYTGKKLYVIDDYFITSLILLNFLAIILESFEGLKKDYHSLFYNFEIFSVAIFSLEYLIRLWISDLVYSELKPGRARLRYITSFFGIIDLLAILPFYLPFIVAIDFRFMRILRLLRIVRIFKLGHYFKSMQLLAKVISQKRRELLVTLFGAFIIMLFSSTLMFEIEHDVQPDNFPNIFCAFWWSVATLTTIGYGDIYPITALGRVLASFTAIFGIGLVAIPTGIISFGFVEELSNQKKEKIDEIGNNNSDKIVYCPYCGKK